MFQDLGDYTPAEIVLWMTERQGDEFARLGLPFAGLWGRPLHAIDCQGLFCETDKYCREAAPRAGRVCGAGKLSFPSFRAAARKAHPRSASQAVADGERPGSRLIGSALGELGPYRCPRGAMSPYACSSRWPLLLLPHARSARSGQVAYRSDCLRRPARPAWRLARKTDISRINK